MFVCDSASHAPPSPPMGMGYCESRLPLPQLQWVCLRGSVVVGMIPAAPRCGLVFSRSSVEFDAAFSKVHLVVIEL